jgi:hypothetical protein
MFANKMFVVAEFIRTHAGPLSTLVAGAMPVGMVWWQGSPIEKKVDGMEKTVEAMNTKVSKTDTKANIIAAKLGEVEGKVRKMEGKLDIINNNTLASVKAASAATRGNPMELKVLVAKIEKCKKSGGKDCS